MIRLFDGRFSLDDVRRAKLALTVEGEDGYVLHGRSSMAQISRDPADLVAQTIGAITSIPTGSCCFLARFSLRPRIAISRARVSPTSRATA